MCRAIPLKGETYPTIFQFLLRLLRSFLPIQIVLCPGKVIWSRLSPGKPDRMGCGPAAVTGRSPMYYCCHWMQWGPSNCHSDIMCSFALISPKFLFPCQCQAEKLPEEMWRSGSVEKTRKIIFNLNYTFDQPIITGLCFDVVLWIMSTKSWGRFKGIDHF